MALSAVASLGRRWWLIPVSGAAGVVLVAVFWAGGVCLSRLNLDGITAAVPQPAPVAQPPSRKVVPGNGQWGSDGQEIVQWAPEVHATLWLGDPAWTDYDFEFEFEAERGMSHGYALIRSPDFNHISGYGFEFGEHENTSHLVFAVESGQPRVLQKSAHSVEPSRWYRVRMVVRGYDPQCYLDDQQVYDVRLPAKFLTGAVALHTCKTALRFRNVRVKAPGGRVLWEGPPEWPEGSPFVVQERPSPAP